MEKHTPYFTPFADDIMRVMPESKNLQRLTKPEIPRKTKKCEVMQ